jgi:hypothetical protein
VKRTLLMFGIAVGMLRAQIGPLPAATLPLLKTSQQVATVPAGAASTLVNVAVDAPPTGQDSLDVLASDPNVVITLLLPSGAEITASNATANGFTFNTYTSDGSGTSGDLLSAFLTPGSHTVIDFPIPAQTGVYSVKANASTATANSAMTVLYYPSSTVALAAATDASAYHQGDFVILSGLLFDGQTPIQDATLTAIAGAFLSVSGTVGSYLLTGTMQLDSTFSLYTYTVQFANAPSRSSPPNALTARFLTHPPARDSNIPRRRTVRAE